MSGIVVSLAGANIDLVVATPPKVQFLQIDVDAKYHFRVYEKFILRIKDKTAVQGIGASEVNTPEESKDKYPRSPMAKRPRSPRTRRA